MAKTNTPNILLLPDGNRRWAQRNSKSLEVAYGRGVERIIDCCSHLGSLGINQVWLGLARPFNMERSEPEVDAVVDACLTIKDQGRNALGKFNITLGGRTELLAPGHQQAFQAQQADHQPHGFTAHLLLPWSAETDIENLLNTPVAGNSVHDQMIATSAVKKAIDYVIRTGVDGQGGRLSKMIPPHSLGAELFFTSELFPDFKRSDLQHALEDYANRSEGDRRELPDIGTPISGNHAWPNSLAEYPGAFRESPNSAHS